MGRIPTTIRNSVKEFLDTKESEKLLKIHKEGLTSELLDFMNKNNIEEFEFEKFVERNGVKLIDCLEKVTVKKRVTRKVLYDCDKLEKKLGKEISKKVIDKEYSIADMNGLIEHLKTCGVNPTIFKKFISVEKTANKDKLDQLFELGEIDTEDVKGCYVITENAPYVDVRVKAIKE